VWSVEHHFTDYTMCPDVLQFLSYMAGKTSHVKLGSMVVVLPWHDPIRVAEQISLLDHLSNGRFILGLGRGLARVEYEGFRLDQNQGAISLSSMPNSSLNALENGYMEGGCSPTSRAVTSTLPGRSFKRAQLRRAVSPESMRIMADGVGLPGDSAKTLGRREAGHRIYHKVWNE
jgi:hypothetical protein